MSITLPPLRTQRRGLVESSPAASEVVDRDTEVKEFLRISGTGEDTTLDLFIGAATKFCEAYTGLKLINQTWELWLDRFEYNRQEGEWWDGVRNGPVDILNYGASFITLPFGPLSSITSIVTYDDDNNSSTFSSSAYTADTSHKPARVFLNEGQTWPTDLRARNGIVVTAVYGYGATQASVPKPLKQAVLALVAWLYENRGECDGKEIPVTAQMLMDSYKVYDV